MKVNLEASVNSSLESGYTREQALTLESNDGVNKIYNNLYAPDGKFTIELDANRMIYLIYVINRLNNQGKWLTHLG